MAYVTTHQDKFGHPGPVTRALDFIEAAVPRLKNMAEKGVLDGHDVLFLDTCGRALPPYVAELSRCYGIMIERSTPGWRGMPCGFRDRNGDEVCVGDTISYDEKEWGGIEEYVVEWNSAECCPSFPGSIDTLRSWGDIVKRWWE